MKIYIRKDTKTLFLTWFNFPVVHILLRQIRNGKICINQFFSKVKNKTVKKEVV